MFADTIFALASGAGRAAIAVLRISGPETARILAALAGGLPKPRLASLRRLRDGAGETLDRALVLWFPAPASYTGEDSAELHLHGGRAVVAAVSDTLVALGSRPAEAGEFTRRAYLNGRLDLTEAEGIADLIAAETDAQRRQAMRQAEGALSRLVEGWSERLVRLLAHQEAAIEFSDSDDLPVELDARAREGAAALRAEIARHLADEGRGERLRDGLAIAIVGAPNAGKSSIINSLTGTEAAIVSARAGTTRDVVEARLDLGGVPVTIADTAGLRDSPDEIEAEGVRRARLKAGQADFLLAVFAADVPPDAETLALLRPQGVIVVANKMDLAPAPAVIGGMVPMAVSARTGDGIAGLRTRLVEAAAALVGLGRDSVLTRPRHRAALAEVVEWLGEAEAALLPEITAEALRGALRALGRLVGQVDVETVLDMVFREFCIGK